MTSSSSFAESVSSEVDESRQAPRRTVETSLPETRAADIIKEEIAQIVGYELEDPRVSSVTVTEVRLSDDRRAAKVYVTVAGDESEHQAAMAALRHAAPYVRKQLGLSLNLPRTPEIHFVRDRVEEEGERVDQLLLEIEREWESQGKEES